LHVRVTDTQVARGVGGRPYARSRFGRVSFTGDFVSAAGVRRFPRAPRRPATTPEPVEQVRALLAKTSKDAIVVTDTPGFASSRLGVLLGLKAIRMLQAGAASAHDIDRTMTEGYGHPMGPLRLTDLVGLDVRLDIAAYLERAYGERFATPELRRTLVRNGELGQKTGKGCYPG
jgi:3-hydroxybutyryl-CoA dehydrogenase